MKTLYFSKNYCKTYGHQMVAVKNPKYLAKQWNTYYVVLRIPATLRKYFPHEQDGSNRKKGSYKTRLAASLNTDALELAEIRSGPFITQFKAMIMAAKDQESPTQDFDYDKALAKAKGTFEAFGSNQLGAAEVAMQLDPDEAKSPGELKERTEVYAAVTKKGVSTKAYVDEWRKQCGYREKNADEAERFLRKHFCPRFPIFELIKPMDLRLWIEDQLQGRNGYKVASRETVKKKVGWINSYWGYCEG